MVFYKEIKEYEVFYFGGGKNINGYKYRAFINIYTNKTRRRDGTIFFHNNLDTIPDSDKQDSDGFVECHLPSDNFSGVLNLLRNEKPIFLTYRDDHKIAYLSTSWEPIGEGEDF